MILHRLSHRDTEDWLETNQFFPGQMVCIAERLDVLQEGDELPLITQCCGFVPA